MKWTKDFFHKQTVTQKAIFTIGTLLVSSALLLLTSTQIVLSSRNEDNIFTTIKRFIQPQTPNNSRSLSSNNNKSVKFTFLPTTAVTPFPPGSTSSGSTQPTPTPAAYSIAGNNTPTPTPTSTNSNTLVTVNENSSIRSVPSDFAGLAIEESWLCTLQMNYLLYPRIEQEYKNLGSSVVRIGGTSSDYASWSPLGISSCSSTNSTFTRSLVDSIFTFVSNIGWKAIWTVNLGSNDPSTFADEANYVNTSAGSHLLGVAIGNEPDLFVTNGLRSSGWGYSNYKGEWESYVTAIKALVPTMSFLGPDLALQNTWLSSFASDEKTNLSLLTQHYYPTTHNGTGGNAPTINNLLSQGLMNTTNNTVNTWLTYANNNSLNFSLDETNSMSGGGISGVANTFGAALWATDYLFNELIHGVTRVNLHGAQSTDPYAPIQPDGTPNPEYYALLLFHYVAPNGTALTTTSRTAVNMTSYSILGNDGKLRVVLINKDQNNTASVQITTSNSYSQATAISLSAPSVTSTSNITFGGNSVASDGTWSAGTSSTLTINGKNAYVTVPAVSAEIVTFQ